MDSDPFLNLKQTSPVKSVGARVGLSETTWHITSLVSVPLVTILLGGQLHSSQKVVLGGQSHTNTVWQPNGLRDRFEGTYCVHGWHLLLA